MEHICVEVQQSLVRVKQEETVGFHSKSPFPDIRSPRVRIGCDKFSLMISQRAAAVKNPAALERTDYAEIVRAKIFLSHFMDGPAGRLEYDPSWEEKADIVIADLPCSGLGIIGRKPDIKYNIQPEDMEELAGLQREILSVVWRYVKPGGRLVYSTCTINPMENEKNADWILEQFPFEPVDLKDAFAACPQEASLEQGRIQFLPGLHPYDGFFISVFRRKENVLC